MRSWSEPSGRISISVSCSPALAISGTELSSGMELSCRGGMNYINARLIRSVIVQKSRYILYTIATLSCEALSRFRCKVWKLLQIQSVPAPHRTLAVASSCQQASPIYTAQTDSKGPTCMWGPGSSKPKNRFVPINRRCQVHFNRVSSLSVDLHSEHSICSSPNSSADTFQAKLFTARAASASRSIRCKHQTTKCTEGLQHTCTLIVPTTAWQGPHAWISVQAPAPCASPVRPTKRGLLPSALILWAGGASQYIWHQRKPLIGTIIQRSKCWLSK